jgi:hypothetical protein
MWQQRVSLATLLLLGCSICCAGTAGTLDAAEDAAARPVDLQAATFQASLQALPAGRGVLMEFYAHWCAP